MSGKPVYLAKRNTTGCLDSHDVNFVWGHWLDTRRELATLFDGQMQQMGDIVAKFVKVLPESSQKEPCLHSRQPPRQRQDIQQYHYTEEKFKEAENEPICVVEALTDGVVHIPPGTVTPELAIIPTPSPISSEAPLPPEGPDPKLFEDMHWPSSDGSKPPCKGSGCASETVSSVGGRRSRKSVGSIIRHRNTWCHSSDKYREFLQNNFNELQNVLTKACDQGATFSDRIEACWKAMKPSDIGPEPVREGRLADALRSPWFGCLVALVIIGDSVFTAFVSDYYMDDPTRKATFAISFLDISFVIFYVIEISLRMKVHGKFYLRGKDKAWNWFDLVLTVQGVFDILFTHLPSTEALGTFRFIRIARLMKFGKAFRLFRAVQYFRDLRVMAQSFVYCMSSMFWGFVVLALTVYAGSIFFVQNVYHFLSDDGTSIDDDTRHSLYKYFGSVTKCMLTLYQSASGGIDWHEVYSVTTVAGGLTPGGFLFFVWFFNFAVVNILSGMFIQKALEAAVPDREQLALQRRSEDERDSRYLTDLVTAMDKDSNGFITLEEFLVHAHDQYADAYLRTLGINITDAEMFFNLLERVVGTGELPIEDFVGKLIRMKGSAKSLDLQTLSFEVSVMRHTVNEIADVIKRNSLPT